MNYNSKYSTYLAEIKKEPYDWDRHRKPNPEIERPPLLPSKTIKCTNCGHDTGLNQNGFMMALPPEGLVCGCGTVIINGSNIYWN